MLDLYKTLRMVEDEITEMKKRQQTVLSAYQQQTREDVIKNFNKADHTLLVSSRTESARDQQVEI